jgi:hypothetical protein
MVVLATLVITASLVMAEQVEQLVQPATPELLVTQVITARGELVGLEAMLAIPATLAL